MPWIAESTQEDRAVSAQTWLGVAVTTFAPSSCLFVVVS